MKFCSNDTEESHSCIVTEDEKWIFFENPKRKKSWVGHQAHHPHRPQDRIALAGRRCSVFGGIRKVWSIMSYWSLAKRLIPCCQQSIWTVRCLKNDQNTKEATQGHFSPWQCSIKYGKTSSGHVGSTQLASSTPRGLLTRLGSFRLPLVCIDGSRTCWAALWLVRRWKMKKWLDEWFAIKGEDFYWHGIHKLPERWEKCVTSNGALWINLFLSFFRI